MEIATSPSDWYAKPLSVPRARYRRHDCNDGNIAYWIWFWQKGNSNAPTIKLVNRVKKHHGQKMHELHRASLRQSKCRTTEHLSQSLDQQPYFAQRKRIFLWSCHRPPTIWELTHHLHSQSPNTTLYFHRHIQNNFLRNSPVRTAAVVNPRPSFQHTSL
jgi:hypothetical protein